MLSLSSQVIQLLLNAGSDYTLENAHGETPLQLARKHYQARLVAKERRWSWQPAMAALEQAENTAAQNQAAPANLDDDECTKVINFNNAGRMNDDSVCA